MSLNAILTDGFGSGNKVRIGNDGELYTTPGPQPGVFKSHVVPFRQYFTSDGTPTGSSQMAITTGTLAVPVEFWVPASDTKNRYITYLSFYIEGVAANLGEFGTGTALTNGCVLKYSGVETADSILHDALKSNFDFIRLCVTAQAFGVGVDAFRVSNAVGAAEAFFPTLDLTKFIPPFGVQLDSGTRQKFVIQIRDNTLTGRASRFDCIASGFDRVLHENEEHL